MIDRSAQQLPVPSFAGELRLTVGELFDWLLAARTLKGPATDTKPACAGYIATLGCTPSAISHLLRSLN